MSFHDDLAAAAAETDARLADERFPDGIRPDYLRQAVLAYPARGGKRLRAALVLWACGAVGGDPRQARYAALAVELYHNWTLIHDDIIDDDAMRRGKPSCHVLLADAAHPFLPRAPARRARFGRDMAILAGDILHGWSLDALGRISADGVRPAVAAYLAARLCGWVTPTLISGEAMDVEQSLRPDVGAAEVATMIRGKTGALLEFSAEAGAAIGLDCDHGQAPEIAAIRDAAAMAGTAFQLKDDILGLFGDERTLGKPVGADLREGKRTLLVVDALAAAPPADAAFLQRILRRRDLTADDVDRVRHIVTDCGALARVESQAASLVDQAHGRIDRIPPGPYRDRLHAWTDYVVGRRF
jgi:geranylgeranyl diphosphate synthase type I